MAEALALPPTAPPKPVGGKFNVFSAHTEVLRLLELAAANMTFRCMKRVLKGLPISKLLNPPPADDAMSCSKKLKDILLDLQLQSEAPLLQPNVPVVYDFMSEPGPVQSALHTVGDVWREKLALDRDFLSAVYADRCLLLGNMETQLEETVGTVSLGAREVRRQYLLQVQSSPAYEAAIVHTTVDDVRSMVQNTMTTIRRIKDCVKEEMNSRYTARHEKYLQAKEVLEEEEAKVMREVSVGCGRGSAVAHRNERIGMGEAVLAESVAFI